MLLQDKGIEKKNSHWIAPAIITWYYTELRIHL